MGKESGKQRPFSGTCNSRFRASFSAADLAMEERKNVGFSDLQRQLTQPKFRIVLVVVLVLGALGFRGRKETDVLQLICSVSLIPKRSGFSRTSTRTTPQFGIGSASARRFETTLYSKRLFWTAAALQMYAGRRLGQSQYHEQLIATGCLVSR